MMAFQSTSLVAVLLLTSIAGNKLGNDEYMDDNYDYDYGDDDYGQDDEKPRNEQEEKVVVVMPKIISEPQSTVVDLGTTIRLPCMVDQNSDAISFIWKRPDLKSRQIVSIGDMISNPDPNNRVSVSMVEKGSILNIGVATVEDAGKYVCSLAVNKKDISITHTVSIRVPPTITKHSDTYIETEKGQQVLMECKGSGNPVPDLKWTRIGKGKMPDGKESLEGEEFVIRNVNRHHAGVYRCTADNGFTKPAYKDIELRVLYKPEITVEEVFVHTKTGNEAELVCNVHGVPKPVVEWRKDGSPVVEDANKIKFQNVHSKHSLILKSVEKSDFGKYTCVATSKKGTAQQTLEISVPRQEEMTSSASSLLPFYTLILLISLRLSL